MVARLSEHPRWPRRRARERCCAPCATHANAAAMLATTRSPASRPVSLPSVDLRDQPTSNGRSSDEQFPLAREQLEIVRDAAWRSRCRGRARCDRPRCQRLAPAPSVRRGIRAPRPPRRRTARAAPSSTARRACASGTRRRCACAATASSAPGPRSAWMSLTMSTPSSSAARMTSALQVSTDTGTPSVSAASQHRPYASQLLVGRDRRRAGTARFAADVEHVGTFRDQPLTVRRSPRARRHAGRRRRTNRA